MDRRSWSDAGSQLALAWQAFFELLRGAPDARLNLWWAGPDGARSGPMLALLGCIATAWALAFVGLLRSLASGERPQPAPAAAEG